MKNDRIYFENLDGLRFIAAMSVICYHIGLHLNFPDGPAGRVVRSMFTLGGRGGTAGVSFFFVLSGFLITYLMFFEEKNTSHFNVPYFYVRRVLRIWPLYYLSLVLGFLVFPWVSSLFGRIHVEGASPVLYSLFLANFDAIFQHRPISGVLGVQWSVAIEEQFYLFWPLLFFVCRKRIKLFPWVLVSLIAASDLFSVMNASNENVVHFHSICAFNELSMGALFAYVAFFHRETVTRLFGRLSVLSIFGIYCALPITLAAKDLLLPSLSFRLIAPFFFCFVILEQIYATRSLVKVGRIPFFTRLGRVSYGLYLLHMFPLAFLLLSDLGSILPLGAQIVIIIGGTILISELSYRYFESYFLGLKRFFSFVKTAAPGSAD